MVTNCLKKFNLNYHLVHVWILSGHTTDTETSGSLSALVHLCTQWPYRPLLTYRPDIQPLHISCRLLNPRDDLPVPFQSNLLPVTPSPCGEVPVVCFSFLADSTTEGHKLHTLRTRGNPLKCREGNLISFSVFVHIYFITISDLLSCLESPQIPNWPSSHSAFSSHSCFQGPCTSV